MQVYVAIGLVAFQVFATVRLLIARQSRERGAFYLDPYQNQALPLFMRNAIMLIPLADIAIALVIIGVLLGRDTGKWLLLPAIAVWGIGYVLAHRVPAPGLPRWLREDIEADRVEVARPSTGDRFLYWFGIVLLIVGLIAGPLVMSGALGS